MYRLIAHAETGHPTALAVCAECGSEAVARIYDRAKFQFIPPLGWRHELRRQDGQLTQVELCPQHPAAAPTLRRPAGAAETAGQTALQPGGLMDRIRQRKAGDQPDPLLQEAAERITLLERVLRQANLSPDVLHLLGLTA